MAPDRDGAGSSNRTAEIYCMVMPEHVCPYGLKAKALLERQGLAADDHWLTTRAETDAFRRARGIDATPQIMRARIEPVPLGFVSPPENLTMVAMGDLDDRESHRLARSRPPAAVLGERHHRRADAPASWALVNRRG
jgi:glutaredoxin